MTFNFRQAFASPSLAAEHQDAIREAMLKEAMQTKQRIRRHLGMSKTTEPKDKVLECIREGFDTVDSICRATGIEDSSVRQWVRSLENEGLIRVTRIASGVANRLEAIE